MEPGREEQLQFAKHFERAQGWLLLENHRAAERALRMIPGAFRRRSEVQLFRAQLYLAAGWWTRAVPVLRRLQRQHPDDPQHAVSLAFAVRRAQSIDRAEEILRAACARFPQEAVIWFNLACYAAQQGRMEEARRLLADAVSREGGYRELSREDTDLVPFWSAVAGGSVAAPW